MADLERLWESHNRTVVLFASGISVLVVAVLDWATTRYISLGFLYLFPIMLASGFLRRWAITVLGIGCGVLSELFGSLGVSLTRVAFESLALAGCGLFVSELVRNRRMTLETQNQQASLMERQTALVDRLTALVETSPAAIVTVDEKGLIELANHAAVQLLLPSDQALVGTPIAAFFPELHYALHGRGGRQFRTSMQCMGHRGNGETFGADVWFSTYQEGSHPKLAAIIGEINDDRNAEAGAAEAVSLNPRETEVFRLLVEGMTNKEIAVRLDVTESIVKNTLQQLFAKCNVRSRSQLVRYGLERLRNLL